MNPDPRYRPQTRRGGSQAQPERSLPVPVHGLRQRQARLLGHGPGRRSGPSRGPGA